MKLAAKLSLVAVINATTFQ